MGHWRLVSIALMITESSSMIFLGSFLKSKVLKPSHPLLLFILVFCAARIKVSPVMQGKEAIETASMLWTKSTMSSDGTPSSSGSSRLKYMFQDWNNASCMSSGSTKIRFWEITISDFSYEYSFKGSRNQSQHLSCFSRWTTWF